jgi:hypothetical protein
VGRRTDITGYTQHADPNFVIVSNVDSETEHYLTGLERVEVERRKHTLELESGDVAWHA